MGFGADVKQVGLVGALRRSRVSMVYTGLQELYRIARHPRLYFSDMKSHPSQSAVLVVDPINAFLHPQARLGMKGVEAIFGRMNKVIEAARKEGIPVFYLCDGHYLTDEELKQWPFHAGRRTWESQVSSKISQPARKSEWVFKQAFSAFKTSGLHEKLQALGVKKLFVLGVATEYCDEANSTDGVDLGYDVTVVSDSIREVDLTPGDGDRAVWRMVKKGIKFLDTFKVVDKILRREHEMTFKVTPTSFSIGPSIAENARPIVTEEIAGSQARFIQSLNFRVEPFPAWLTQTDKYQLVMAYMFFQLCRGRTPIAHFETFFRKLPADRNFMIFSGMQDTLWWMMNARMDEARNRFFMNRKIIRESRGDKEAFADYLRTFRFNLDVWGYEEGTPIMPMAPYMGTSGPLEKDLIFETKSLSMTNSRSAFSTRAAQYRLANPEIDCLSMEMRRMDDALSEVASFEAWKQGFVGTSNEEAAFQYDIDDAGTNSHAMYLAMDQEIDAVRAFLTIFRDNPMVLTETYHALVNALKTSQVLRELGMSWTSFRQDSGKHFVELMNLYARIIEMNGFQTRGRVATSDIKPPFLAEMREQEAVANAMGAGTMFGQVPATPGVFKLSEIDGPNGSRFVSKLSKSSLPGIHQVWRRFDRDGHAIGDTIALLDERIPDARPLMVPYTSGGYLLRPWPTKEQLREQYARGRAELPREIIEARGRYLEGYEYPVTLTPRAAELRDQVAAEIQKREIDPYLEQLYRFVPKEEVDRVMGG